VRCLLRNRKLLLDTRASGAISFPMMSFFRFLLFCFAGLVTVHGLRAEPNLTRQDQGKARGNVAAESSVTFSLIHVDGPYIAMTFDDGPSATLTPRLLDILAAHHIRATFFVIGENVAEHPEVVARAAREGHEIGNHSWSHPNLARLSDDAVRRQLWRTDDAIKNATGIRPRLLRPPYGSITARQKGWIHNEFVYEIILWDVDPYDWKRPGPSVVRNRILKETRPGSIVLSHDIHPGTIEAMPSTFDALEAKGFKFVTVSELIRMGTTQPARPPVTHESVPPTATPSSSPSLALSPSPSPTG
jgi:peptidoglycan-N-acetylglucosamine deacetylase